MKNGEDRMKENILFETISNEKLKIENNNQLLDLIKSILAKYKLSYSEILINYLKDKNLLKIFELSRRRYRYTRESYLSDLSLTYILVYLNSLLERLEEIHERKSISECFLDKFFEDENKLTYFFSDLVGDVFNKHTELSKEKIVKRNNILLFDTFLTGLNKMKLKYNIYFGRVSNKFIMNYKTDKEPNVLQKFVYTISNDLSDKEILFIYNLPKKDVEQLTNEESKIFENIIKKFRKKGSKFIVKPNFLIEEDIKLLEQVPRFLSSNNKIIFDDFQNCNEVLGKEALEVYTFNCTVNKNVYFCKIRKIYGALHLYFYDEDTIIFKDRIYFLEDLRRFLIVIEEYNQIKENDIDFWS